MSPFAPRPAIHPHIAIASVTPYIHQNKKGAEP